MPRYLWSVTVSKETNIFQFTRLFRNRNNRFVFPHWPCKPSFRTGEISQPPSQIKKTQIERDGNKSKSCSLFMTHSSKQQGYYSQIDSFFNKMKNDFSGVSYKPKIVSQKVLSPILNMILIRTLITAHKI